MEYETASEFYAAEITEKPIGLVEGYIDLDLNQRLIRNRAATHIMTASETGIEGIRPGDILVVDRSIQPRHGHVIISDIDGEYTLRRLIKKQKCLVLGNGHGE